MNKNRLQWGLVGIVILAFLVVLYSCLTNDKPSLKKENSYADSSVVKDVRFKKRNMRKGTSKSNEKGKARKQRSKKNKELFDSSMFGHLSDVDKKLCEAVQKALDANDVEQTIKLATKLMASSDPDARSHAVDALGWFGEKALPELTVFMGDANEEVAQNAINTWEVGFSEIEDVATRFNVSKVALRAISSKDALESIGSQFTIAASEYIDEVEDKKEATNRRIEVVQSLVDMIDSPNKKLSNAGRNFYEEITGHNWISVSEAELYIKDPENYESP